MSTDLSRVAYDILVKQDDYIEQEWKQSTYADKPYKTPKQRPKVNRDERFSAILRTIPRTAFR